MESLLTTDQRKLRDEVRAFVKRRAPTAPPRHGRWRGALPEAVPGRSGTAQPARPALSQEVRRARPQVGRRDRRPRRDRRAQHQPALPLQPGEHRRRGAQRLRHAAAEGALAADPPSTASSPSPRRSPSRAAAPTSSARRPRARRDGDAWVLNGQKRFIVGAEGADYFLVYARTSEDRAPARVHKRLHRRAQPRASKCSTSTASWACAAAAPAASTSAMPASRPRTSSAPENGGGVVFNQMMIPERMTSAAGALGGARAALEIAARYSRPAQGLRHRRSARFEGVSFKVADSITLLDAARALVYAAARAIDSGDEPGRVRRLVSEAKKFATETGWADHQPRHADHGRHRLHQRLSHRAAAARLATAP